MIDEKKWPELKEYKAQVKWVTRNANAGNSALYLAEVASVGMGLESYDPKQTGTIESQFMALGGSVSEEPGLESASAA